MVQKIGLIGSAGLGRSTFAATISKEKKLYFLQSKDITRPILKKYGYTYGQECVEKFLSKKNIEFELVSERIYEESLLSGGFITDRTTLECFCYALLNTESYTDEDICLLEDMCKNNMSKYTKLFYFPYNTGWLEENGLRTTSKYFQWKIDMMIRGIIQDWNIKAEQVPLHSEEILPFLRESI